MTRDDTDPAYLSARPPVGLPLLAELESYWRAIRGARILPTRTEVDPAAIDAILPWAFVLERVAPEVARMRVAGQKLSTLLGMEARGMPICAFFSPEARTLLAPLVAQAFDAPAIVDVPLQSSRRLLRPRMTGRLMILPLCDAQGQTTRAIGAILCDGVPGRMPARFDIGAGLVRCERLTEVAPDPAPALRLTAGAGARTGASGRPTGRPGLRLVVSNG